MEINIKKQGALLVEQQCVAYRDLYFRLVVCLLATHIILMVGEDISSLKAFTIPSYYPTLVINYVIALVLAYLVKRITLFLDRNYHWDDNVWLRTILQFALGIGFVSLASFFLVFLYFKAFGRDIMASGYTKYELPFSMALLTILNLFYVVYYFWIKWQWVKAEQEFQLINEPNSKTSAIYQVMVYKGAAGIPLQTDDIASICKVENTMLVYTFDKEQHVTDKTLEELEQSLDSRSFFRLNRQLIVHISCCKKYELLDYGKLMVTIEPKPPVSAIVSQRKAPLFRKWIVENS